MMSVGFEKCFMHILDHEGEYSNDYDDSGGETKFGISQKQYPDLNIKNLTLNDAHRLYRQNYYDPMKIAFIHSPKIGLELFDFGVNVGIRQAILCIQRALKVIDYDIIIDGIIGPQTIGMINDCTKLYEIALLNALRGEEYRFYRALVLRRNKDKKFIRGWLKRI